MLLIALLIFAFVSLAVFSAYWFLFQPTTATTQRLREIGQTANPFAESLASPAATVAERVAEPLNRLLPPAPDKLRVMQRKLLFAGYRAPQAALLYRAIQLAFLAGLPAATVGALWLAERPLSTSLAFILGAALCGYLLPRVSLDKLIANRQLRLQWGLADALDLLTITIEAGMNFNAALVRVSEELKTAHPALCEEFDLVNLEIRVGRARAQALRNLAERTGVEDMRAFCAILIQADRYGTSVGRAIRVYANTLRTKRRQRAEQAAQRAAVKLLLPLALFLFPTLFIVVLGPAFLTLMDMFFNN
ncbi:MAG: type II secretion system F family protein [Acidobacteria bacterium]|nr:type II secretion system F family protein [Acidobacteriota bacterium]MBI3426340.1 type II secretion system F family protein [Acidobacteriota bacterium]